MSKRYRVVSDRRAREMRRLKAGTGKRRRGMLVWIATAVLAIIFAACAIGALWHRF